jgi:DNA-binding beta-propeller fold protein YncE
MTSKDALGLRQLLRIVIPGLFLLQPAAGQGQTVTATIPVGINPVAVAVNPVTHKIYVADCPQTIVNGHVPFGTVTIIDGATNATAALGAGVCPRSIAVNPVTNRIYVASVGCH